jgi:hypothetical protein
MTRHPLEGLEMPKVLALENIHPDAVAYFRENGFTVRRFHAVNFIERFFLYRELFCR